MNIRKISMACAGKDTVSSTEGLIVRGRAGKTAKSSTGSVKSKGCAGKGANTSTGRLEISKSESQRSQATPLTAAVASRSRASARMTMGFSTV